MFVYMSFTSDLNESPLKSQFSPVILSFCAGYSVAYSIRKWVSTYFSFIPKWFCMRMWWFQHIVNMKLIINLRLTSFIFSKLSLYWPTLICDPLDRHLKLMSHEPDDRENHKSSKNTGSAVCTRHYYSVPVKRRRKNETKRHFLTHFLGTTM